MGTRTQEFKDYYGILRIPVNAQDAEIKKAYRKLALENHPDHHPDDPESENRFKEITEAYGVLIDPDKRRQYDRFRVAYRSGRATGSDGFDYSQQDIFEELFRKGFSREMFEELNREFSRSGVRSGKPFFAAILFGGALGGLGRILGMIPGPIGKIGYGLKVAQMVGSSILAFQQMRKDQNPDGNAEENNGQTASQMQDVFAKAVGAGNPLDLNFSITLSAAEALAGSRKKISYKAGAENEQLVVRIPPQFPDGGKLRIREKGYKRQDKRGDLILTVNIESLAKN